jgi:pullulanase
MRSHTRDGKGWMWRAAAALLLGVLGACGGGGGGASEPPAPTPPPPVAQPDARLPLGNASFQTVLDAQPPQTPASTPGGGGEPTTLTVHYQRADGVYAGWQLHSWGAGKDPGWNQGHNASATDAFGAVYELPLTATSGAVGYLFHKGDDKDHGGTDQSYTLKSGKNEIWRKQGDASTYLSLAAAGGAAPTLDIDTIRVHYRRLDGNYAAWGLHLWNGSGLDLARLPSGLAIDQWGNALGFERMGGYQAGASEVVFDLPVINPKQDGSRTQLEFIIHGKAPNEGDKDGRPDNIRVRYADLAIRNRVGSVWLVQGDATVYSEEPDLRRVSIADARAFWLNRQVLHWPLATPTPSGGAVKLYHSAAAQLVIIKGEAVRGADGNLGLESFSGSLPADVAERFKWLPFGARFKLPDAQAAQLGSLLKSQLVVVQEDAAGLVQNATTLQVAGALDDLYAAAANVNDLGVKTGGTTSFKLWAPTAQKVLVFSYPSASGEADGVYDALFDPATGVWSASAPTDLSGKTYRYAVETVVRGVGRVRNLVTDPYSVALTADGKRSGVLSLQAAATQPAGWDASTIPPKVQATPDMSIYELHVRDFSANDASVPVAHRGKYLAFSEPAGNGMKHLKSLADAGLTDVHLLPVYDFSSVPETGCTTPAPAGGPSDEAQQAAVKATQGTDCFNWGYDPQHYNAPEGSYASDANDLSKRVVEFRRMVMGLHAAGLRVGMDVVYNHTSTSGQSERSVLDRIVPGYYHRLNEKGDIETSTCCENTATEHLMMGKLMSDSVLLWAREYKIASFRFDIMGHQPRSVMEAIKARLKTELGREVQLLGEGWNFGEVADGRRFVQASMWSLNGSGIGTFSPFARDAIRGGGPMDGGDALIANQGFVNGLWYDANAMGSGRSKNDLMWQGDLIKAGLAGSIRSYTLLTHWGETKRLEELNGAGYVVDPGEAVNYIENHDNQTLFDNNAFKLPAGTSPRGPRPRADPGRRAEYLQPGCGLLPCRRGHPAQQEPGPQQLRRRRLVQPHRLDLQRQLLRHRSAAAGRERQQLGPDAPAAAGQLDQAHQQRDRLDPRRLPRPAEDPRQHHAAAPAHRRRHQGAPALPQRRARPGTHGADGGDRRLGLRRRQLRRAGLSGERRQGAQADQRRRPQGQGLSAAPGAPCTGRGRSARGHAGRVRHGQRSLQHPGALGRGVRALIRGEAGAYSPRSWMSLNSTTPASTTGPCRGASRARASTCCPTSSRWRRCSAASTPS